MGLSDKIRAFVFDEYIRPARVKGKRQIELRAGDIHRKMRLDSRVPAVCSAIESRKFQVEYRVKLINRKGPHQSTTTCFTFEI